MSKILSANVTEEQYAIIKRIAESNGVSVSALLKDSVKTYILLYYLGDILEKLKVKKLTEEVIERDSKILEYASAMTNLMQPYFEKALSNVPKDVIKALEEEGKELAKTIKIYEKPIKRGRRPALLNQKRN